MYVSRYITYVYIHISFQVQVEAVYFNWRIWKCFRFSRFIDRVDVYHLFLACPVQLPCKSFILPKFYFVYLLNHYYSREVYNTCLLLIQYRSIFE